MERVKKCPKCKGSGELLQVMELHGMPHIMGKTVCDKCNGTGITKAVLRRDR